MALVTMNVLLERVKEKKIGCGSFSIYSVEMLRGVVRAAEEKKTPIILQIAEGRFQTAPIEIYGSLLVEAARNSTVDIAVHLDHGINFSTVEKVLNMGFTSVMYDGSHLPFEKNIENTKKVKEMADAFGADTEAELGLVGRSEGGDHDYGVAYTVPEDAKIFLEKTGVAALAIAIGNQHGNYTSAPELRIDILDQIHKMIPEESLVLHGGSGITDKDFQMCIRHGMCKINIATAIINGMLGGIKKSLDLGLDFYKMNAMMVEDSYKVAKHHIEVFNMETLK